MCFGVITMTIKEGDFIKISYTGKLEDGTVFDTTDEELAKASNLYNPNSRYGGDIIIVGENQTIKGLEEDIKGHDAGYEGTASIPPENGFGDYDKKKVKPIPVNRFEQKPQEGMQVQINGMVGTVLRIMGRHARVDFNSPMAGQTVIYDYKIDAVLDGDKEKAVGLSTLYTGTEMDVEIDGTVANIDVPMEFSLNQSWLMAKSQMAINLLKHTDLTEVRFIESYSDELLKGAPEEPEEPEDSGETAEPDTEPQAGEE